ncbi:MAG: response regulator transcription factor [Anaerolineae bacterium]|nr:response regulator transcription factor [Anaerolineae bacterium]
MIHKPAILVVDDEPGVLENLTDLLRLSGYEVIGATNGAEAIQILEKLTPDLIIADIMMPRMNGYQLYLRIRQNPDWMWIPFIFLSAKGEAEDIRFGKELGSDDYLTKPVEPDDLLAAIRGRLARYEELESQYSSNAPHVKAAGQYQVGPLVVDLSRRQVMLEDQEVKVSPTEFDILQRLILTDGGIVLYGDLLGYDDVDLLGDSDAAELLRYHIRNLRQKLREAGIEKDIVLNVRGVGYRLSISPSRL